MDFKPHEEFSELSIGQLHEYNQHLMRVKDSISEEQRAIQAEITRRGALASFEAMSDKEKEAVAQHIAVHGIGAKSAIGSV